jgi:uncharacterized protein (TIGR00369 family)
VVQTASRISVAEAQAMIDSAPFGRWWGFRATAVSAGEARVSLPARPELYRPGGVLHGPSCIALADVGFWIAIASLIGPEEPALTLDMTTSFLDGARGDLEGVARVLRAGKRTMQGTVDTYDGGERLVAHHSLTYIRQPARPTA